MIWVMHLFYYEGACWELIKTKWYQHRWNWTIIIYYYERILLWLLIWWLLLQWLLLWEITIMITFVMITISVTYIDYYNERLLWLLWHWLLPCLLQWQTVSTWCTGTLGLCAIIQWRFLCLNYSIAFPYV